MKTIIDEICQFLADGILHVFSLNERKYLYVSNINRFYEIDDLAFNHFIKIQNRNQPDDTESFINEFKTLKINPTSGNESSFLRVYITDTTSANETAAIIKKQINEGAVVIVKCEIIIQIDKDYSAYQNIISDFLFPFKELWEVFKIKTNVTIKASQEFFTRECMNYLKSKRFNLISQITEAEYLNQPKDKEFQTEILKDNLKLNDLDEESKYFLVLNKPVMPDNYANLLHDITSGLNINNETPIPESFQNILRVFKTLTSKGIPRTIVLSSENQDCKKCNQCWAQRICKFSSIYETFGNLPRKVCENPLNCDLIYRLTENLIDLINHSQKLHEERSLRKQQFEINPESVLTLINP
jgi:hypothetical protein